MGKVLIIGAGGVATVAAHKVAKNTDVFSEIMIASRTKSKCDAIVKAIGRDDIKTAQVDADSVEELVKLFNEFKPDLVMNLALPYQDLTIMEACLQSVALTSTRLTTNLRTRWCCNSCSPQSSQEHGRVQRNHDCKPHEVKVRRYR